ncbi:ABC transporter permease [Clostridioides difficile]|uniref:ABC transporter permease n=1 Tax=unclassified Clostridioides TaxID=2635829 RepID=UPI0016B374EC|nr:ABC transporter permease [Clostridioides difficile]MDB3084972.1 ABC transporter permease [Clostridioides difficile]MDI0265664.1 ABC transporter permease [Clostridioides difficile]MDI7815164.1 ABC transporter permease [Clostridioides difficile]NJI79062.1 ABC transporter permease [Clostridioides difficile]
MIRLIIANIKRYIKNHTLLVNMVLFPVILVFSLNFFTGSSENQSMYFSPVAIVSNSSGKYEHKLIDSSKLKENSFGLDEQDKAMNLLKNNKVSAVFILDKNFSSNIDNLKRPVVKCFKTENGGGSLWAESQIESFITNSLKLKIDGNIDDKLTKTNIIDNSPDKNKNSFLIVFLICYFMYINAAHLASDLFALKKSNTLKRLVSTKHNDIKIIFSIFLGLFFTQAIVYTLTLVCFTFTRDFKLTLNTLMIVLSNSFVATGFVFWIARVFKNESSISLISTFYSLIGLAISISSMIPSLDKLSFMANLSKLTPFYWTIDAINNNGNILINIIVLILIGMVFVTAGSLKLRDFARN